MGHETYEGCLRKTEEVLKELHKIGMKVSKDTNWCTTGSGRKEHCIPRKEDQQREKGLADKNTETIKLYKKTRIVKEMMGFLGTTGFCSEFIPEYAEKVKELRKMTKREGMKDLRAELKWTDEGNKQFENIKKEVIMVTRTGMIYYDQPFYVDVAMKKGGLATAVLFQGEGKYKRSGLVPVALLSSVACELAPLKIVFLCVFFLFLPPFLYV